MDEARQCQHRDRPWGRRILGPRCRRVARWRLYERGPRGEGSVRLCAEHKDGLLRRSLGLVCEPLR